MLLALMVAQVSLPASTVFGDGLSSCRYGYERARQSPLAFEMLTRWERGFWSGLNLASSAHVGDIAQKYDPFSIESEIGRECTEHPDDLIYNAETRVYQRFKVSGR